MSQNSVFTQHEVYHRSLMKKFFRVYCVKTAGGKRDISVIGFVVVHPQITSEGLVFGVTPLNASRLPIELLSDVPTQLLSAYVNVKRKLDSWDGVEANFPLRQSSDVDQKLYYYGG